jgi:hypothetical protein
MLIGLVSAEACLLESLPAWRRTALRADWLLVALVRTMRGQAPRSEPDATSSGTDFGRSPDATTCTIL